MPTTQRIFVWLLLIGMAAAKLASSGRPADCAAQQREWDEQMDSDTGACMDFFEHACGNWRPPLAMRALGAHDTRTLMRAQNKQLLIQHFEQQDRNRDRKRETHSSVASFYSSCLAGQQTMPVYTDALRSLANWPLLNSSEGLDFDWALASGALRRYGAQSLWRLLVQANWQAADQRIFYLMPPAFELLRSAGGLGAVSEESAYLYERYLKYLLLDLGVRVRRANAMAAELLAFELQLLELTPPDAAQTLVLRAPQTLQQLADQLPGLRLLDYFGALLAEQGPLPKDYAQRLLIVADTAYLGRLERLLKGSSSQTLAKWLLLQFLAHFELHLHEARTLAAQREHCLQQLNAFLPRQLSQLYLRLQHGPLSGGEAFLVAAQVRLQRDFVALKLQFEHQLNGTAIFENDTAAHGRGLEKLRAMRLLLPLPLEPGQDQLQLGDSYDENRLRLAHAQALAEFAAVLACLGEACGTAEGQAHGPLDVNAYYRLKQNAIELPVGLLRAPLWNDCSGPRALGGLGYVLGHELLHAFDYDGINYDRAGNVASQWSARAIIKFGVRAGCYLTPRYSNATLTINENIADSEGLRLAFETFRGRQSAEAPAAPAVAEGQVQSFFVAFAQTWCGHAAAGGSQHASHRERVNNALRNFPEFSEAFHCKPDDLMNPEDKCRIW